MTDEEKKNIFFHCYTSICIIVDVQINIVTFVQKDARWYREYTVLLLRLYFYS